MQRLERLVVHIEEALRLARYEDDPHLQLALMLLDSAAELILHRVVQGKLTFHHLESQLLKTYDRGEQQGLTLDDAAKKSQAELRKKVLSRSKLKDLDRNFDAKAEYLRQLGDLPEAEARVLRKLHAYRNEAHHRDRVRSGSLRSAVNIYSYLVCTMMRDLNVTGVAVRLSTPVALKPYLGDSPWSAGLDAPRRIAEKLLASSGMDRHAELGIALGNHLDDRLQAMLEGLEEIVGFISDGPTHEEWDTETALVRAGGRSDGSVHDARRGAAHEGVVHARRPRRPSRTSPGARPRDRPGARLCRVRRRRGRFRARRGKGRRSTDRHRPRDPTAN